jgi:hypothetical protein
MMNTSVPTYEQEERFKRDLERLTADEKRRFYAAVRKMVHDLKEGQGFRKSLRVKGLQSKREVYEMTWADDGRALFKYGTSPIPVMSTLSGCALVPMRYSMTNIHENQYGILSATGSRCMTSVHDQEQIERGAVASADKNPRCHSNQRPNPKELARFEQGQEDASESRQTVQASDDFKRLDEIRQKIKGCAGSQPKEPKGKGAKFYYHQNERSNETTPKLVPLLYCGTLNYCRLLWRIEYCVHGIRLSSSPDGSGHTRLSKHTQDDELLIAHSLPVLAR